jgi:hypothetical protein
MLGNLFESLWAALRMKLRKQVRPIISKLVSREVAVSDRYRSYYESLDQLKVTLTVFLDVKVTFRLNCLKPLQARTRTTTDLTKARISIIKVDELMKVLTVLVHNYKSLESEGYFIPTWAVLQMRRVVSETG